MCYHNSNKINKRLALFGAKSYEEMRKLASPEDLYIIEELERLGMNDKFIDEYDAELVNKTLMESLKEEGINEGIKEGKIEMVKNMLREKVDKGIICRVANLSIDEINNMNV